MRHRDYLYPFFVLVCAVCLLWFWSGRAASEVFPHFDKLLHTGGGAACGIFGAWLYFASGPHDHSCAVRRIVICVSAASVVTLVGVGIWEGLEIFWPPMIAGPFDLFDTIGDIIADFLGAAIAAICYAQKIERGEKFAQLA